MNSLRSLYPAQAAMNAATDDLRVSARASRTATDRHLELSRELREVQTELARVSTAMNHRVDAGAEAADVMILARIKRAARRAEAAANAYVKP